MTKTEQIYEWIKETYSRPGLDQSRAIPSIHRLVEQFSTSKGTVEKALVKLLEDGILRSEPKRGYFPVPLGMRPGTLDLALGPAYSSRDEGHIFSRVLAGFALAASGIGRDLRIFSSLVNDDSESAVAAFLKKAPLCQPFGVAGLGIYSDPLFVGLRDLKIPAISLDYDTTSLGVDCVVTDSRRDARTLATKLIELGHRAIACVVGPRRSDGTFADPDYGLRIEGFKDALLAKGLRFKDDDVIIAGESTKSRLQHSFMAQVKRNKVTAALIDSHNLKNFENILYSREIHVKFAIFQDKSFTPPECADCVVSARYDFREMGRLGVEILGRRIDNGLGRAVKKTLDPEIA